jgi:hypothetical protein
VDFKPARLDRASSIVTILTVILLTAMSIVFVLKVPFGWGFAIFSIGLVIGCYLFSVKNYRIEGGKLIIEKILGRKVIPIPEIENYMPVDDFLSLKPLRAFGNGGLFGYYGIFTTHDYGQMHCYLTSLRNVVMLKTRRGIFVLSPENTAQFESQLSAYLKGVAGAVEKIPPIAPEKIRYAHPLVLLLPDAIFAVVVIGTVLLYPALPPYVATHFNFQGLADRWSPKSSIVFMGLLPSIIIFALTILLFVAIRRRTSDPKITYFIVGLLSFIQFFMGFIFLDVFWFNIHQAHFFPLQYLLIIFLAIMAIGLYGYYHLIKKS